MAAKDDDMIDEQEERLVNEEYKVRRKAIG